MKTNKELNETEFAISQQVKRAMLNIHEGDHENAEINLRAALRKLSSINYRPVRVTNEDQWS